MALLLGIGIGTLLWLHNSVDHPLDTEKIKLLAEISQSSNTYILNIPGAKRQNQSFSIAPAEFRDILLTLAPIEGSRKGQMQYPKYELGFQTRMDPTMIYVRELSPTRLEFEIDGHVYIGGDGLEFKRRIEAITNPSGDNPSAPDPDAPLEQN